MRRNAEGIPSSFDKLRTRIFSDQSGVGSMKRFSTFPVMRATLLS
jgi:hypothetical protein